MALDDHEQYSYKDKAFTGHRFHKSFINPQFDERGDVNPVVLREHAHVEKTRLQVFLGWILSEVYQELDFDFEDPNLQENHIIWKHVLIHHLKSYVQLMQTGLPYTNETHTSLLNYTVSL
ncbi:cytochrome P450 2C20 [Striga asiatica]|uniref:Cytochrome P450 2C20 n=1 Tax=Striga asiatica TaxID=4170 RepID=A0A5A7RB07_STRAF|nr:cytochrome P450 2C20 [Striga asiatica]